MLRRIGRCDSEERSNQHKGHRGWAGRVCSVRRRKWGEGDRAGRGSGKRVESDLEEESRMEVQGDSDNQR